MSRSLLISRMVDKVLEPEALAADPFLISRYILNNGIPISDICTLKEFMVNEINVNEVLFTICESQKYIVSQIPEKDDYLIQPQFIFCPAMLVLRDAAKCSNEIKPYIVSMCGAIAFWLYPDPNNDDLYLQFKSIEDCMAFWRGIKYYPFKTNKYIKTEIFSPLRLPQNSAFFMQNNNGNINNNNNKEQQQNNSKNSQNFNHNNNHRNQSYRRWNGNKTYNKTFNMGNKQQPLAPLDSPKSNRSNSHQRSSSQQRPNNQNQQQRSNKGAQKNNCKRGRREPKKDKESDQFSYLQKDDNSAPSTPRRGNSNMNQRF